MINNKRTLVTIFTRNRNDALAVNLMGLYNQLYKMFDVLVIDDNSSNPPEEDPFISIIKKRFNHDGQQINFVRMATNNGIAKNRSMIIDQLKEYDFVMDLNDDHYMDPDCINQLINTINRPDVVAVGTATPMFFWSKQEIFKGYHQQVLNDIWVDNEEILLKRGVDYVYISDDGRVLTKPIEQPHLSQFMYKPSFIKTLPGGYSKLGFTEETDLSLRLKKNSGLKLMFQPNAINWHMQYVQGGIREVKRDDWPELIKADWKIFSHNWLDWVKRHYREWHK